MKKISIKHILQVIIPFAISLGIIYWLYKDLDFDLVWDVLKTQTNWFWMFLSLCFGVLSHVFRGLRWTLALEPLGEKPRKRNSIYAIFTSYAVNLVVPRLGEFTRCGVLSRYDRVSFSKSLGSVVAERFVDSLCAFIILFFALMLQGDYFIRFFNKTGISVPQEDLLLSKTFWIIILCFLTLVLIGILILHRLNMLGKVRDIISNIWQGFVALRKITRVGLYLLYTCLIWGSYFLHFYLTFYCFPFTADLNILAGLALFIVGSFAVIIPTPNGAGPWHFMIITLMTIYGINVQDAGIFALIVHTIQTFLVVLLGTYGFVALPLSNNKLLKNEDNSRIKS